MIDNNKHPHSTDIEVLENCHSIKIGAKAKNIKIIKEKGKCLIPKTLVVNINIFNQLLRENKISEPLNYNWSDFQIPAKYQRIILKKIKQEFNDKPLVIRSSATCEDSPLLSFAGQYSSFLNLRKDQDIIKAIKLCYRSLFSDNAKIYAKINGVRLEDESMAIIIQELVPVKIAGVIFTSDPINQDKNKVIVEYIKGLGDSLVSGHKKPILRKINKKKINDLQNVFLRKLLKIAVNLEKVFGAPQDIEWGWDGREIYIFQSRDITTLNKHPKIANITFNKNKIIGSGIIACRGIASGSLKIINNIEDYDKIKKGDIVLIRCKTDISLIKKMPLISALIIKGGILSHIAVIAREFNIPCLVEPKIEEKKVERDAEKKIIVDALKGKILLI